MAQQPNHLGVHYLAEHSPGTADEAESWDVYAYRNLCTEDMEFFTCATREEAVALIKKLDEYAGQGRHRS